MDEIKQYRINLHNPNGKGWEIQYLTQPKKGEGQ